ncbi:MAG: outer membrane beta-barrel protein [Beijerinckiaceae bacterium]
MNARKLNVAIAAGTLALASLSTAAFAADLPTRKAAVLPPPPVFTWTGLYVGFNYGYTWKGSSSLSNAGFPLFDSTPGGLWAAAAAAGPTGVVSGRLNGFFGGAQIGYNWQLPSRIVLGVEADIQGGGIRGGGGLGAITPSPTGIAVTSGNMHRGLEHFGTVRARAGYAITPGFLAYLTGGLAYGGAQMNATFNQALNPSPLISSNGKTEYYQERVGWTLGVGGEMAIAPNLSAKLEYLYYDLGTLTAAFPNYQNLLQRDPFTGAAVATGLVARSRINGHILRTGLNYRFGGQGDAPNQGLFSGVAVDRSAFGGWSLAVMPYMWAVGPNGTSTAKGQTTEMNLSFVDVLTKSSSLPLEVAANMELRNGPLSFYLDAVWIQIRAAGSVLALRNPIAGATLTLDGDARMKQTIAILEGGGTYEVGKWAWGGMPGSTTSLDVVGGLRYWNVGVDLSLNIAGAVNLTNLGLTQVGGKAIAKGGNIDWVDPFIGLRLRQQVDERNAFYIKGDVGGFGVGSKFAWQGVGGYTHDFMLGDLKFTSMVGYRAVRANYMQGSGFQRAGVDMIMHGPVAGLGFKF